LDLRLWRLNNHLRSVVRPQDHAVPPCPRLRPVGAAQADLAEERGEHNFHLVLILTRISCEPSTKPRSTRAAWFKRRSQLRGGWGRRPEGDAPRSEAGVLGARWRSPARPQPPRHPALVTHEDPGVEPCLIPCGPSLTLSRLPAWSVLRCPLLERPGIGSALHASHATKCYVFPAFSKIWKIRLSTQAVNS